MTQEKRIEKVSELYKHMQKVGSNITTMVFLLASMPDKEFEEFHKEYLAVRAEGKAVETMEDTVTIKFNKEEAQKLIQCLIRTSAKGDALTFGIELEDKLAEFINKK